jgi:DNA adenine methylase
VKSYLRYPGNKYDMLPHINKYFERYSRKILIEPFVGSGAVSINTNFDTYLCYDINPHLIDAHKTVQSIDYLEYMVRGFFEEDLLSEEHYYSIREKYNNLDRKNMLERTIFFIYLNRFGFSGLVRFNGDGQFNVSYADRKSVGYCPFDEIRYFREKSKAMYFHCNDFRKTFSDLYGFRDAVIYADPPYVPLSRTSNFVGYSGTGFGEKEHKDLNRLARESADNGTPVIISNSLSGDTLDYYRDFNDVETFSDLHSHKSYRGRRIEIEECLFIYE